VTIGAVGLVYMLRAVDEFALSADRALIGRRLAVARDE